MYSISSFIILVLVYIYCKLINGYEASFKFAFSFENLIKNSADQIGVDISDFQCNEDSIAFEVDGVSVFEFLIPIEGGAKLRLLYDVVNV